MQGCFSSISSFPPKPQRSSQFIKTTRPLSWEVRIRILGEVCSTLIFLLVHGDLKPDNILDAKFGSKLGDFGISRFLIRLDTASTTLLHLPSLQNIPIHGS
uniref:RING-type E3 ubiquitin transferase n=1 Tax=Ananas comosus var. bracteatus TaxID=296719 RepID=A0A6V7QNI6_ANACO|nr:unnamed protein product [Ananas comosus var. bracteatus]